MERLLVKFYKDHLYYNNRAITKEYTMRNQPVSRFAMPEPADLLPNIQQRFTGAQEKAGSYLINS